MAYDTLRSTVSAPFGVILRWVGVKTARNRKAIIFAFKFILSTFYYEITIRILDLLPYCLLVVVPTSTSNVVGARGAGSDLMRRPWIARAPPAAA
eukprot:COSAG02_NODE_43008_length_379_cov_0.660714_1_plen_94_part_01